MDKQKAIELLKERSRFFKKREGEVARYDDRVHYNKAAQFYMMAAKDLEDMEETAPVVARLDCGEVVKLRDGDSLRVSNGSEDLFGGFSRESELKQLKDVAPGRYRLICLLLEAEQ